MARIKYIEIEDGNKNSIKIGKEDPRGTTYTTPWITDPQDGTRIRIKFTVNEQIEASKIFNFILYCFRNNKQNLLKDLQSAKDCFEYIHQHDPVERVNSGLAEVKVVMTDNIDKLLERGEKIEGLVDRTEALKYTAEEFAFKARKLRESYECCPSGSDCCSGFAAAITKCCATIFFCCGRKKDSESPNEYTRLWTVPHNTHRV